ncbi:hypothetical protein EYC84_008491 [Monilinia fructicola]|uniref:Uncharacterized protein n=1 Tax=Monilinia fructicola TaxID=38448 RepID=A0A5M9JHE4_MONFR|nr:hypothetical protein EYC84_008491 [Monilinia fructicola]
MSSQTDRIWKSHQPTCPCTGHAQDSADSETSTTGSTNSFLSDSCTKFFPLCHGAQSDIARRHRAPTIKDRCWDHTCPFPSAACSCVPGLKAGQWPGTLPSGLNFASSGDDDNDGLKCILPAYFKVMVDAIFPVQFDIHRFSSCFGEAKQIRSRNNLLYIFKALSTFSLWELVDIDIIFDLKLSWP